MNENFMKAAFRMANKAFNKNEVPVGAVIVRNNKIIAMAYNKKEKKKCAVEHAEIIAIRKACKKIKNWRLSDCEMYVTLEPCPMCASAIKQSRIKKIYYVFDNNNPLTSDISNKILNYNDANKSVEKIKLQVNFDNDNSLSEFFSRKRN